MMIFIPQIVTTLDDTHHLTVGVMSHFSAAVHRLFYVYERDKYKSSCYDNVWGTIECYYLNAEHPFAEFVVFFRKNENKEWWVRLSDSARMTRVHTDKMIEFLGMHQTLEAAVLDFWKQTSDAKKV